MPNLRPFELSDLYYTVNVYSNVNKRFVMLIKLPGTQISVLDLIPGKPDIRDVVSGMLLKAGTKMGFCRWDTSWK